MKCCLLAVSKLPRIIKVCVCVVNCVVVFGAVAARYTGGFFFLLEKNLEKSRVQSKVKIINSKRTL